MLGELIKDIRITYGISPKAIADGLCSVAMLKKYESGELRLEKLFGDALLQRLGKSMEKYDVILDADEYDLFLKRSYIQELLRMGKTDRAEDLLAGYDTASTTKEKLHNQFCALQWAEVLKQKEAPIKEQEEMILQGLKETLKFKGFKPEIMRKHRFGMLELLLLERYAIINEIKGNIALAERWYVEIMAYLDQKGHGFIEYDLADKYRIYPLMAYQLAGLYVKNGKYDKALELLEVGCKMLGERFEQPQLFVQMKELKHQALILSGREVPKEEIRYQAIMKEILAEYAPKKGCTYPMYCEMYVHSVNDTVRERRIEQGASEADLADDVCDVRTVYRIESGMSRAQNRVRKELLEKVGLEDRRYDGCIVTRCYSDYCTYVDMAQYDYEHDFIEARKSFETLKKKLDQRYLTNYQFVKYWEAYLAKREGVIGINELIAELWRILLDTMPGEDFNKKGTCTMFYHERMILKSISWEVEDVEHIKSVYNILEAQFKRMSAEFGLKNAYSEYYNAILYCLARMSRDEGNLKISEKYIERALNDMWKTGRFARWERCLFMKLRILMQSKNATNLENQDLLRIAKQSYVLAIYYRQDQNIADFIYKKVCDMFDHSERQKEELLFL